MNGAEHGSARISAARRQTFTPIDFIATAACEEFENLVWAMLGANAYESDVRIEPGPSGLHRDVSGRPFAALQEGLLFWKCVSKK